MPELPEVYTITSDLNKNIKGWKITNVYLGKEYKTNVEHSLFHKQLLGLRVTNVNRIAKNILIEMENSTFIRIHLAMSGQILLRDPEHKEDRWTRLLLEIENGNEKKQLRFTDMRMFGKVQILNTDEVSKLKEKYGIEPISENASEKEFYKAIKSKKTNIKNVLLDQNRISGLGNIYATDALFIAGINPKKNTKDITEEEASRLYLASKEILEQGILHRGSTLPDKMYVDIFGNPGSQQDNFRIYLKKDCPKCNTRVEFIKLNGRGTYFCPDCQPTQKI